MTPDDVAATPSARAAVQAILERGVETVTQPGSPVGCMISSGMLMVGSDNAGLAAELRNLRVELRDAVEARVSRDIEAGVLPDTIDPATLARFYSAVLQGLSVQAVDGATRAQLQAVVTTALRAWPV